MTTERRSQDLIDQRFWQLVGERRTNPNPDPGAEPTPDPSLERARTRFALLWVALASGAAAGFIAVALFRLHLAAGAVWLYVGAPALVLAAICPADRAIRRRHGRRTGADPT